MRNACLVLRLAIKRIVYTYINSSQTQLAYTRLSYFWYVEYAYPVVINIPIGSRIYELNLSVSSLREVNRDVFDGFSEAFLIRGVFASNQINHGFHKVWGH